MTEANLIKLLHHFTEKKKQGAIDDILTKYPHLAVHLEKKEEPVKVEKPKPVKETKPKKVK